LIVSITLDTSLTVIKNFKTKLLELSILNIIENIGEVMSHWEVLVRQTDLAKFYLQKKE
jgi:hypothetical protein